jgi:hypothetical protein
MNQRDFRFCHIADIETVLRDVRFGGKADIDPLLLILISIL